MGYTTYEVNGFSIPIYEADRQVGIDEDLLEIVFNQLLPEGSPPSTLLEEEFFSRQNC